MQLIVLSVLVALRNHLDKTALLPGFRACVKEEDVLSEWLKVPARWKNEELGSIAEIILN